MYYQRPYISIARPRCFLCSIQCSMPNFFSVRVRLPLLCSSPPSIRFGSVDNLASPSECGPNSLGFPSNRSAVSPGVLPPCVMGESMIRRRRQSCVDKLNAQFHGKRNVTPSLIWGSGRSGGFKRSRSISTPTNDLIVALSFGTPQPPFFFAPFPAHQARVWALMPGCNSSALTSCAPRAFGRWYLY